jgi:hypothetical protein
MQSSKSKAVRVSLSTPKPPFDPKADWLVKGEWPAHWISLPQPPRPPFVAAYRLKFTLDSAVKARIHVTADERYELFIDGERIGRGSERGDIHNWFFESYDLDLSSGDHKILAKVWTLGDESAGAQFSLRHGFLLGSDDKLLSTGSGAWQGKVLPGYSFRDPLAVPLTGWKTAIDGREYDWELNDGWSPAESVETARSSFGVNDNDPCHYLTPAVLPAMFEERWQKGKIRLVANHGDGPTTDVPIRAADNLAPEAEAWQGLLAGLHLEVPAHTCRRVIIDLEDYVCAYPELTVSGGRDSSVRIDWQEALFEKIGKADKGNRDEIEGKFFTSLSTWKDGPGDLFVADGGASRSFTPLWWEAGRYVEILVRTADQPLTLNHLDFLESRYPYAADFSFSSSDPRLQGVIPIALRTLEMCSHETFMDCPHYEQLQYVGDTRLEALVTYITSQDDRLCRKALRMFNVSREISGLTFSRYPSRIRQIIPPFSLWWIGMVHDFAMWRGDLDFVRSLMPGVRAVLDAFRTYLGEDGLLHAPDGWNFMDWVPGWGGGMPAGAEVGVSGLLNLQLVLMAKQASELENMMGEQELAVRQLKLAERTLKATTAAFYDKPRGLFADDLDHKVFSEHSQCLALLCGVKEPRVAEGLLSARDLARTTIYFSYYLFEAYRLLGRTDRLIDRMGLWFDHPRLGMKTLLEHPEPSRSDCHAWGAHPVYHYFATILGIRPLGPGMAHIEIKPNLGPLDYAEGSLFTPLGPLKCRVDRHSLAIELPAGIEGSFQGTPFKAGKHSFPL